MMMRSDVSRRLKAGRWLAGEIGENGKAALLPVADLASRPPLADNNISANRLEEIEQEKVDARPMELERIAVALGLHPDWFFERDVRNLSHGPQADVVVRDGDGRVVTVIEAKRFAREVADEILDDLGLRAGDGQALRDASRAVKRSLADQLEVDAGDSEAGSGTRDAVDATSVSPPARRARRR